MMINENKNDVINNASNDEIVRENNSILGEEQEYTSEHDDESVDSDIYSNSNTEEENTLSENEAILFEINEESVSENSVLEVVPTINYISEFENIYQLLNTQIKEFKSVKNVSENSISENGVSSNSIFVSLDNEASTTLINIKLGQEKILENQDVLNNLVGCLLLVVVMQFLFASAKRTMKKMTGRKE